MCSTDTSAPSSLQIYYTIITYTVREANQGTLKTHPGVSITFIVEVGSKKVAVSLIVGL